MRFATAALTIFALTGTAQAQTAYTAEELADFFVNSVDLGATRGICIGTPDICAARQAAVADGVPQSLDMMVNFNFDSAELTPAAAESLKAFAEAMRDDRLIDKAFRVEGHTDAVGRDDYNITLSQARANAVRAQLESLGIVPERLIAEGFGKNRPRSANGYDAINRRVEMRIDLR